MENKEVINVVDAPTGAGKTTVMIGHISNEYNAFKISNKCFIVMLPFLSEIDRIKSALKGCNVEVFDPIGRKTEDILTLIKQGKNIVTTHSCFMQACFHIACEITKSGFKYDLFCDEEPPVFKGVYPIFDIPCIKGKYEGDLELLQIIAKDDLERMCRDKFITIDKTTLKVQLNTKINYKGGMSEVLKRLCQTYDIYYLKAQGQDKQDKLILLTNNTIWSAFESVTVFTYRFKTLDFGIYCRLYGTPIKYYHIENETFVEGYREEYPLRILGAALKGIHFNYSLSKTWYENNKGTAAFDKVKKAVASACRGANKFYYWCTFNPYAVWFKHKCVSLIKSDEKTRAKGTKSFRLPCNAKATNEYINRTTAVYACGRYMHPDIKRFLDRRGVAYNEEQWALSALIQFIWRSNLRDSESTKTVDIFVLAKREWELFKEWLDKGKVALNMG